MEDIIDEKEINNNLERGVILVMSMSLIGCAATNCGRLYEEDVGTAAGRDRWPCEMGD
jgi:hypothetical protein